MHREKMNPKTANLHSAPGSSYAESSQNPSNSFIDGAFAPSYNRAVSFRSSAQCSVPSDFLSCRNSKNPGACDGARENAGRTTEDQRSSCLFNRHLFTANPSPARASLSKSHFAGRCCLRWQSWSWLLASCRRESTLGPPGILRLPQGRLTSSINTASCLSGSSRIAVRPTNKFSSSCAEGVIRSF